MLRVALSLMLLMTAGAARADSPGLPFEGLEEVSRDNRMRVSVLPGSDAMGLTQLVLRIERRDAGGAWRATGERPFQHQHPADIVVGQEGQGFATVNSWYGTDEGISDAIVVFRADGSHVRRYSLKDIFPAWFIAVLPRTTSDIQWVGYSLPDYSGSYNRAPVISPDGSMLVIPVQVPGATEGYWVDLQIALADGRVLNLESTEWQKELKRAEPFARAECAAIRRVVAEHPEDYRDILADPAASGRLFAACKVPEATLLERIAEMFAAFGQRIASLWGGGVGRG